MLFALKYMATNAIAIDGTLGANFGQKPSGCGEQITIATTPSSDLTSAQFSGSTYPELVFVAPKFKSGFVELLAETALSSALGELAAVICELAATAATLLGTSLILFEPTESDTTDLLCVEAGCS
jgi:hypothetical protein